MRCRFFAPVLVIVTVLVASACSGEREDEVADRLDEKGVREVLSEASEDEYTPPEDGKLTREQIEMYLHVREREQEIARVARQRIEEGTEKFKEEEKSLSGLLEGVRSLGSAADFLTADIRAAQELGYNTAEYEWVKSRVLEAATSIMRERLGTATRNKVDERAESLRRKMEETENETEKNTYRRLLETYEKTVPAEERPPDESVIHNRTLLSEYEDLLDILGTELSKWEIREGQAAEKVRELDRDLETMATGKENP